MDRCRSASKALLWAALALASLLVCAGVVVDASAGLAGRRTLQDAANACALAGAHELCSGTRDSVATRAGEVASSYLVEMPLAVELRDQEGLPDPTYGHVVHVEASAHVHTPLVGLLGGPGYLVRAGASATCGEATGACGLWPLALSERAWARTCGTVAYVCVSEGSPRDIDCSATDCDMDDDGIDDVLVGADRAWVDLPGSPDLLGCDGCAQRSYDTAECCPIAGASTGCMALPACLPGTRDVRPSLISGAYGRSGRPVGIPIYGDGGSSADHACPKGNGHSIVRLGCAVVEPPLQEHETSCALGTYPCYDASTHEVHLSPSVKSVVVRVMVACGNCTTDCGATVGNPPPSGGGAVLAVSLID